MVFLENGGWWSISPVSFSEGIPGMVSSIGAVVVSFFMWVFTACALFNCGIIVSRFDTFSLERI